MTLTTTGKDRRQHKRHEIAGSGFALLQFNDAEVLGSINDISTGGLSLSHIDNNEGINGLSSIDINLISKKACYEHFTGRNIWGKKEGGGFTTALVKMKQCGIEFEQLNHDMQLKLNEFIDSLDKKQLK